MSRNPEQRDLSRSRGSSCSTLDAELSNFGRLYRLLDSLVTRKTLEWLHDDKIDAWTTEPPSLTDGSPQECFRHNLDASFAWVSEVIEIKLSTDIVHERFVDFCSTFRPVENLAGLKGPQWRLITCAMFEAMSWLKEPELEGVFQTSSIVIDLLDELGMTSDHYKAILDVFAENRLV